MSPSQYDPNTTSRIRRDELRALVSRARDTGAQLDPGDESARRADGVVIHRHELSRWLERGGR